MRSYPLILCASLSLLMTSTSQANELRKINFIQQQFDQVQIHSKNWQWGWFGFLGSAAVIQGIAAHTSDDNKLQYDMSVGAVTSFLGAADMLLNPMRSHNYSVQLRRMEANSKRQKTIKLQQAETWLAQAAAREAYEQSWTNHLLAGLVNGLAGLAVAYDDKRPIDGWLTFASGVAVSEFKIYTAPQAMIAAQQAYQAGDYTAQAANNDQQRLFIAATGPNLLLKWTF